MKAADAGLLVVHVSPRVQGQGGIERLHEFNRRLSGRQVFVALFDRGPERRSDYINLGFTWRTPLAAMRRAFARALEPFAGALVIYHNAWGLPLFYDVDGASRRLVFLHGHPAYHQADLPALRGLLDGVVAVNPFLRDACIRSWPEISVDRFEVVRAPLEILDLPSLRGGVGHPLVLGYAGRLEVLHKRVDRLPGLVEELRRAGVDFRFEVLGDGKERAWLEERLRGGDVRFHGWVPAERLWSIVSGWDALILWSDREGGPIAFFEGAALGAIPFYPAIGGSWGDVYAPQIDPVVYYPPGDLAALARAIKGVFSRPETEILALREKGRSLMRAHRPENYERQVSGLIAKVLADPRISVAGKRRLRLTDWLPLGLVTRIWPRLLWRR